MGRVLGVIPARSGSKGISEKNIKPLAGRPLIQYAIECAREVSRIDRTVVSTDSPYIAELAANLGADIPFLRPSDLATDQTPMFDVIEHAVTELEAQGEDLDLIVLLQPTAPLRRPSHVNDALDLIKKTECDSVVSVVEIPGHYRPHYAMKIDEGRLVNFLPEGQEVTRRQDAPPAYSRDGTVYVIRRDVLMNTRSIYGNDCRPLLLSRSDSVNLDTLDDWNRAEELLRGAEMDPREPTRGSVDQA